MGLWHHRVISIHKSCVREKSLLPATLLSQRANLQQFGELTLFSTANTPSKQYHQNLYSKDNIAVIIDGKIINLNHISNMGEYVSQLYQTYGKEGLYRLEGAFSLILYDEEKQLTLLFRSFLTGNPL